MEEKQQHSCKSPGSCRCPCYSHLTSAIHHLLLRAHVSLSQPSMSPVCLTVNIGRSQCLDMLLHPLLSVLSTLQCIRLIFTSSEIRVLHILKMEMRSEGLTTFLSCYSRLPYQSVLGRDFCVHLMNVFCNFKDSSSKNLWEFCGPLLCSEI